MKPTIEISEEPQGATYEALLDFAAKHSERFSLVWREQMKFNPAAHQIAVTLQPYLIGESLTNSWPGTQLRGRQALVRQYRTARASLEPLRTVGSLYAWRSPNLPEDLTFYTADKVPWLITVSHEHMAWFPENPLTLESVQQSIPGIILHQQSLLKDNSAPSIRKTAPKRR